MHNLNTLAPLKQQKRRLLGLDVGDKTVGIAISDINWIIASPLLLIKRISFQKDVAQLQDIIKKNEVCALVAGLPVNMNGTEGPQAEKTRNFLSKVSEVIDIPIVLWDERLSTMAVTRTLLEADISRKKRKDVVDKMAATYILQGVLDRLSHN